MKMIKETVKVWCADCAGKGIVPTEPSGKMFRPCFSCDNLGYKDREVIFAPAYSPSEDALVWKTLVEVLQSEGSGVYLGNFSKKNICATMDAISDRLNQHYCEKKEEEQQ